MRISDTERQRAIDELRRHCAAGRIDVDEYAQRIERALAATTLEELDKVLGDLPIMRIADPSYGRRGAGAGLVAAPGWLGRLSTTAVVLISVLVVVACVVLLVSAEWAWVALLLAGWLAGLAQGRLASRRR